MNEDEHGDFLRVSSSAKIPFVCFCISSSAGIWLWPLPRADYYYLIQSCSSFIADISPLLSRGADATADEVCRRKKRVPLSRRLAFSIDSLRLAASKRINAERGEHSQHFRRAP